MSYRIRPHTFFLALLPLVVLPFQNCGKVDTLQPLSKQLESPSPLPYSSTASHIKPALAIRAGACIACHAVIHGDFITDFGFGNRYFFGRGMYRLPSDTQDTKANPTQSFYGVWPATGGSSFNLTTQDQGKFIVPRAQLIGYLDGSDSTVKDFLVSKNLLSPSLTANIEERSKITIAAPTSDDIKNLIPLTSAQEIVLSPYFKTLWVTPSTTFSGFQLKFSANGRSSYYITNQSVLNCFGDVIVDGTLFLNKVQVNTDANGCRLYVTGSVFIQDVVTYVGQNASVGNLQVSSARAVIMGMSTLNTRMQYAEGLAGADSVTTHLQFNQLIAADRDKIDGLTDDAGYFKTRSNGGKVIGYLRDLDRGGVWYADPNSGLTDKQVSDCTSCSDSSFKYSLPNIDIVSRTVNFRALVLNAPVVMSRYLGEFHGSVIAEFALFKLEGLEFFADPTLTDVTILPLVNSRIFSLSDD